jgi:hypothetical protein
VLIGRKRLVRVHYEADGPTFEGVLVGRSRDHYRLKLPKLIQGEQQTMPLDGEVELPRERVVFVQLLAKAG